ncbi:MAG: hypothetical protein D3926_02715 [Desulfobacteraceae bacterium]|nr:MAG: hypothetical protein D3926_02715 [Desulfobacteraceae bacterium]
MKSAGPIISLCILLSVMFTLSSHAKESLTIITDDWPPYEYEANDRIVGFSTEIVEAVLKDMNVKISSLRIYPWARAETLAFSGKVDMIYSASKSSKRLEHCHFPDEPLIISPNVLFIRKADVGKLRFDSFSDLKGYRVGIVRDYAYTDAFLNYLKIEGIETITVWDDTTNFKALIDKRVDYIPADLGNGRGIVEKLSLEGQLYAFQDNPLKTAGLYTLFSKKRVDASFVEKFSQYLARFKATAAYRTIHEKYFSLD